MRSLEGLASSISDFSSHMGSLEHTLPRQDLLGVGAEYDMDPNTQFMKEGVLYSLRTYVIDYAKENPKVTVAALTVGAIIGATILHSLDRQDQVTTPQTEPLSV